MIQLPTRFFIASGKATSTISGLNAFDQALVTAGISEANLVPVSSVLPRGIRHVEKASIERGAITFCVLAREDGGGGKTISAGIAYVLREDGTGGYVAEGHMHGTEAELRTELEARAKQMAGHRGIRVEEPVYRIEELEIPEGRYGSCMAALVFLL
ncbi:MAG TPA: pyruvoyl-dependent arginine decarboxylase [Thermoplasmata archaeon]|nr:pyruvoyl-dependent arginine decarboxylase [Thermoplasmata archaeon]